MTGKTDGGSADRPDHQQTWRYREGEDGEPTYVRDTEEPVAVKWEREDGADSSTATLTYLAPDGGSITIQSGDTILGPDGEERITISGWRVTTDPWLAVEVFLDLPPGEGGEVPWSPLSFADSYLAEWRDGERHWQMADCVAAQGDELAAAKWQDEIQTLKGLEKGDSVVWGGRKQPLTVTSTQLTFSQYVYVEGPRGGQYKISWGDGAPTITDTKGRSLGNPRGVKVVE